MAEDCAGTGTYVGASALSVRCPVCDEWTPVRLYQTDAGIELWVSLDEEGCCGVGHVLDADDRRDLAAALAPPSPEGAVEGAER